MEFNVHNDYIAPDPVPSGIYAVEIVDSSIYDGLVTITYLSECGARFTSLHQVAGGDRLARQYGIRTLKGLCYALGISGFDCLSELHGRKLEVTVVLVGGTHLCNYITTWCQPGMASAKIAWEQWQVLDMLADIDDDNRHEFERLAREHGMPWLIHAVATVYRGRTVKLEQINV